MVSQYDHTKGLYGDKIARAHLLHDAFNTFKDFTSAYESNNPQIAELTLRTYQGVKCLYYQDLMEELNERKHSTEKEIRDKINSLKKELEKLASSE